MNKQLILLLSIILINVNSVYLGISAKPVCIIIEEQPGKTIKFFYQVTGQSPQNTEVEITPQDGTPLSRLVGASDQTVLIGNRANQVCFKSTDKKYKSVSIDFYTHDKAHLMQLALKSQIYELHTKLIDVGQNLKDITKNEQFQEQRQMIHAQMINQNQSTIKTFAVVKLIAIILVAAAQFFLLKNMLGKSSQGYQPV